MCEIRLFIKPLVDTYFMIIHFPFLFFHILNKFLNNKKLKLREEEGKEKNEFLEIFL